MSVKKPSVRDVYTCPYRYKCNCYVALSVKNFPNKVEIALAGEHDSISHLVSSGILSVKQRCAVKGAVRSAPHAVGSQIHVNLQNFSPGKRVPFYSRSQHAVARLVRAERQEIMADRLSGVGIDGTEGCMNRLHESLCLETLIANLTSRLARLYLNNESSTSACTIVQIPFMLNIVIRPSKTSSK